VAFHIYKSTEGGCDDTENRAEEEVYPPMSEDWNHIAKLPAFIKELRLEEIKLEAKVREQSKQAPKTWKPEDLKKFPSKVDYSHLIQFVRHQGAWGCFANSIAACWDILNEMACPYSPNVSVNRYLWGFNLTRHPLATIPAPSQNYTSVENYLIGFGCPTEGTELTNSDAVSWPTPQADNECSNYRLKSQPISIKVDVNEFKKWLLKGPFRVGMTGKHFGATDPGWGHFTALVGYDDDKQRFTFINSWGDQWPISNADGFDYVNYSDLNQEVDGADFYEFVPPTPVPVARVKFTSSFRQDVYLWLGVEGKVSVKRIWPEGQRQDKSRNLTLTATLPTVFKWPPTPNNRLYLDVLDSGASFETGGDMVEFTARFGGGLFKCEELLKGPKHFEPHVVRRFYIEGPGAPSKQKLPKPAVKPIRKPIPEKKTPRKNVYRRVNIRRRAGR